MASRLGWTLVHSLWQGAMAALLFAVLRFALRRASADARYLAGCCTLGLMAVAPAATFMAEPSALFPFGSRVAAVGMTGSGAAAASNGTATVGFQNSVLLFQTARALEASFPWLVAGWLLGMAVFLVRWLQGYWWVRRAKRFAAEEVEAEWVGRLNDLKCRLEIFRPVRLLKSALVEVPMVVGWLRPVILLPASSLTGLTPQQLETILAHELAHVRRYDYLVNIFQTLVETVLFYHPAVWWISRCVREERENCCDDLVVHLYEERIPYARALMALETLRGGAMPLAMGAGGGSLLQRIRRLLGAGPAEQPPGAREFSALALVGLGAVFAVLGFTMMFRPETYQANCRIRLEPNFSTGVGSNNAMAIPGMYDPYFIQTEFEVIQSPVVLNRVVDSLELTTAWAQHEVTGEKLSRGLVLVRLRNRLTLRPIRNTMLIDINVRDEDPAEAARLANAIARAYQQYRLENQRLHAEQGLHALQQRLYDTDRKIEDARKKVEELSNKLGIAAGPQPVLITAETLRRVEQLRVESQAELVRQQTLLEKLNLLKADPDTLAQTIPTSGIQDALLGSLLEQRTMTEQHLVSLQHEFGPQNLEVIKVTSQLADLKERLRQRVAGILLGLEAHVASLGQSLDALQKEVQHAQQADLEAAAREQPYFVAKQELEGLQRFREVLYMKLASDETDLQLPKGSRVEIIDQAAVPPVPVSPNRARAGALLGSGLLLMLLGLLLLKSGPRNIAIAAIPA